MQVTQTIADGLKHQFQVIIPAGQLSAQIDSRLVEVGRTARIPGFRPGKVPLGILRKKYGQSVLSDVVEGAVNDGTDEVLKTHAVRPALRPKVEITSFSEGADLVFTIGVESLPVVEVADLSGLSLERPVAAVTDEAVAEALERLALGQQETESAPAGAAAASGDVLVIDFEGSIDGVRFDGGAGQDVSLKLGSQTFIPGFEDQLIGAKVGDAKIVAVRFPDDYGKADLAGKAAQFAVTVKDVRHPIPTAVDEGLAGKFGFDSLDDFRDRLRREISDEYAGLSRARLKRRLMDALAERHSFGVPEGMVDVEFNGIWSQLESDRAQGQLDPSDAAMSEEELKREYRSIAERRVRLGLVLSEIGQRNGVVVSQEDLNRALYTQARRYPGQEQAVIRYYQQNADAMMSLRAPLFEEKVVDFLIAGMTVTDVTVPAADLLAEDEEALPPAPPAKSKGKKATPNGEPTDPPPAAAKPAKKAAAAKPPTETPPTETSPAETPPAETVIAAAPAAPAKKAAPRKKPKAEV